VSSLSSPFSPLPVLGEAWGRVDTLLPGTRGPFCKVLAPHVISVSIPSFRFQGLPPIEQCETFWEVVEGSFPDQLLRPFLRGLVLPSWNISLRMVGFRYLTLLFSLNRPPFGNLFVQISSLVLCPVPCNTGVFPQGGVPFFGLGGIFFVSLL